VALTCRLSKLNGVPVFVLPPIDPHEAARIIGAMFYKPDGIWLFPAFYPYCEDVVRDLRIVFPGIVFDEKVTQHLEEVKKEPVLEGFGFITKPYQHQEDALRFALKNLRCGLFYDMGLGKTKIVIDLIRYEKKKALILTPVIGIGTWLDETAKHAGDSLVIRALRGTPQAKTKILEELADVDILVVGYDTAKLYQARVFEKYPYEIIVADESHQLRDNRTDRTKAALALASKAARRIIMSGTPALGNPMHLYGQLAFLGKFIPAKDFWTFRRHHVITSPSNKHIVIGYKNLDMLNEKLHRTSIVKSKDECLDLPPRTSTDIYYDVNSEQRRLYNDFVAGILVELENGMLYEPEHAAVTLQKLLQILSGFIIMPPPPICDGCEYIKFCVAAKIRPYTKPCRIHPEQAPRKIQRLGGNPKLDALNELLDSIFESPKSKVIIWGYFTEELNIVEESLKERGVGYIRVDGSNSQHAQTLSTQFNNDPAVRVWLAQVSTGVALTLTGAAYMIYFGLTYRLDDYLQSMDRNYRIGQTESTFVYRLLVRRSVLAFVAAALATKENIADTLTKRINCIACAENERCVANKVEPFAQGCIFPNKIEKKLIRAQKL